MSEREELDPSQTRVPRGLSLKEAYELVRGECYIPTLAGRLNPHH